MILDKMFCGCQIRKYLAAANLLYKEVENITAEEILQFAEIVKKSVCKNTAKTIFATFAARVRALRPDIDFKNLFFLRIEKPAKIALSEIDLRKIEKYKPQTERETFAQTVFLLCAKTGARLSDALLFAPVNIDGDFLHYISEKTKTNTFVPVGSSTKNLISFTQGWLC